MAEACRDPRVDPQSGDELRVWWGGRIPRIRKVCFLVTCGVEYKTASGKYHNTTIEKWKRDMRNAEVLKVGGNRG